MKDDGSPENKDAKTGVPNEDAGLIEQAKKRLAIAIAATSDSHRDALDDLRFLNGEQWPERQRKLREAEGRPVLTFNKLPTFVQQVTNDQRQNKVSMRVSPANENQPSALAEVIQGMVRHIEYDSSADIAVDTATNSAAQIGFGYFRFITEYESPMSFNQIIKYARIRNPFTVYMDPASVMPDGSDQEWCLISGKTSKGEFKAKHPNATTTIQGFTTLRPGDDSNKEWLFGDEIRTAEYYFKKHVKKTIYLLKNGVVSEFKPQDETQIVTQRETDDVEVWHAYITPFEVISKTRIMCPSIPVFPIYGTELDVDGKVNRFGVVRNAKDPCRMYNFWMTAATEEVALRPKAPFIGAKGAFKGEENRWKQANQRSFSYLEYNPINIDGVLTPPPARQPMADIPNGMLTMAMHANDNIKATTGLFDSSLGASGNAQSGKQELAQQRQGNIANFHYTDNAHKTLRHAGKCLIYMIPRYYDTERIVQTRAENGEVSTAKINQYIQATEEWVNQIRGTTWNIAVSMGPSYSTMRAEAADSMMEYGKNWPKLMDVAGDKIVKALNWPGAEDIAERIARTIPANIKGDENAQEFPPEAQQIIDQLQAQLQELEQMADDNNAKVTVEQIRQETAHMVENIRAESRADVEELKGFIQLLVEQIQPAPGASSEDGAGGTGEKATATTPAPVQPQAPDQQIQLLTQIADAIRNQQQPPIIIGGGRRKMTMKAPSGASYEAVIDDDGDEEGPQPPMVPPVDPGQGVQ